MFLDVGGSSAATQFLPYTGYFTLGWLLRDVPLTRRLVRAAAAGFVVSVVTTALLAAVVSSASGWGTPGNYVYGYLSPTVVAMSVSAFLLLRAWGLRHPPGTRWAPGRRAAALSALTFGVYLVHPLFLFPVRRWLADGASLPAYAGTTLVHLTVTVGGSLALTWVLLRVPLLRRTV